MKINIHFLFLLILSALFSFSGFSQDHDTIPLIPKPVNAEFFMAKGKFHITPQTVIIAGRSSSRSDAGVFNDYLAGFYGFKLKIKHCSLKHHNAVILKYCRGKYPKEGYEMTVTDDAIIIKGDVDGVFYALQTLRQLLPSDKKASMDVPACHIVDYPRYSWRGMHLDVGRHFFPKEFILKYIDYLAMYKMNTFHWHLTDDQGWRIEIRKYPKLTEIGAWRDSTLIGSYNSMPHRFDHQKYGGYYTQVEIREIVEYAGKRHITIVPEIEMPGHSLAALASYPELACTSGPFHVEGLWGVFDDVYCPTETTFSFLENVLSEVADLFPGKYVHIGGDEVPKDRWKNSPECQALMKKEKLKDESELQSYFVRRIENFLNSKHKTLVGWDEILEGGLAPNATVMSWRGTDGGIEAARQNHDVIMTPGSYCYFDHYQGDPRFEPLAIGGYTTVKKTYSYDPTPSELTAGQQKHILGAQGNLWTEYIDSPQKAEYMIFPRICALSEVDWTPVKMKDYNDFRKRLIKHFNLLDQYHVNYAQSLYQLNLNVVPSPGGRGVACNISRGSDSGIDGIYYTVDGSTPGLKSAKYTGTVGISQDMVLKAAYFEGGKQKGSTVEQAFSINKATGKPIKLINEPDERYNTGGAFTLVDGITGAIPWYGKEWLGFSGKDLDATIDLSENGNISKITVDVLNSEYSWIYLPKGIEVLYSTDGNNYTSIKKVSKEDIDRMNKSVIIEFPPVQARFIRVVANNIGKIPAGKPGEGYDAWLFVDEIKVE